MLQLLTTWPIHINTYVYLLQGSYLLRFSHVLFMRYDLGYLSFEYRLTWKVLTLPTLKPTHKC